MADDEQVVIEVMWDHSSRIQAKLRVHSQATLRDMHEALTKAKPHLASKEFCYLYLGRPVFREFWGVFEAQHFAPTLILKEGSYRIATLREDDIPDPEPAAKQPKREYASQSPPPRAVHQPSIVMPKPKKEEEIPKAASPPPEEANAVVSNGPNRSVPIPVKSPVVSASRAPQPQPQPQPEAQLEAEALPEVKKPKQFVLPKPQLVDTPNTADQSNIVSRPPKLIQATVSAVVASTPAIPEPASKIKPVPQAQSASEDPMNESLKKGLKNGIKIPIAAASSAAPVRESIQSDVPPVAVSVAKKVIQAEPARPVKTPTVEVQPAASNDTEEPQQQQQQQPQGEQGEEPQSPPGPAEPPAPKYVEALYKYKAKSRDQLDFEKGDILEILIYRPNGKWWFAKVGEKKGWIPHNFVKPVDAP